MNQRPKLEIPVNEPVIVELIYDEAITGQNGFGEYYLYAVKTDGKEYSFFAHPEVHKVLKNFRRGDMFEITRLAYNNGKKINIKWIVRPLVQKDTEQNKVEESKDETAVDITQKDHLYQTLLTSYKDAIELQKELNGMIDIEKAAITLFIARSKINGNGIKLE
ncbi:MAG: hypothetical protein HPY57_02255 [Ignavibacteria bacterium]|nr:hypothetical protein [Ignavibacteria bacterium]